MKFALITASTRTGCLWIEVLKWRTTGPCYNMDVSMSISS